MIGRIQKTIYLDNAATSYPKPPEVYREMSNAMRRYGGNPGRGSHALSSAAADALFDCRTAAAEMFSCEADDVALTFNATHALNIAIKGLMGNGGNIMISDIEHNSVLRPVSSLCKNNGCTLTVYPTHGGKSDMILNSIEDLICPDTRLIVACHMSNVCGIRLPVEEIGALCRQRRIAYVVDASQSAGHIPINARAIGADAICMPGHKGLMGPQGTGLLITGGERLPEALLDGGSGVNSLDPEMPDFSPERYEAGTLPAFSAAVLARGIRWVKKVGIKTICDDETRLKLRLLHEISGIDRVKLYGDSGIGGTLLFNIDGVTPSEVGNTLNRAGICVRTGLHCSPLAHRTLGTGENGAIRVSVGYFNKESDIVKLRNEVARIAQTT